MDGFIWFWLDDDGATWRPYSPEDQRSIEAARLQGHSTVVLQIAGHPYRLDLNQFIQESAATHHQRPLSRASEFTVWFWKDDHGVWQVYDRDRADRFTRAEIERENDVYFQLGQTLYHVDLARRLQTNMETGGSRPIHQGLPGNHFHNHNNNNNHHRPSIQSQQQHQHHQHSSADPGAQPPTHRETQDAEMVKAAPPAFLCPINHDIMRDPVTTSAGSTYDRDGIQWWLRDHDVDPMTNRPIPDKHLIPNRALHQSIQEWITEYQQKKQAAPQQQQQQQQQLSQGPSVSSSSVPANALQDTLKVVFLGANTGSLVHYLIHGENVALENDAMAPPSLNINTWIPNNTQPLKFQMWDFGGPDAFHAYRSMFLLAPTLFVLVWDMSLTTSSNTSRCQDSDVGWDHDVYHKMQFWIDLIQERFPKGAVILPVATLSGSQQPPPQSQHGHHHHHHHHHNQRLQNGRINANSIEDSQRRECRKLRQFIQPGTNNMLYFGDHDPILRAHDGRGVKMLREKLMTIANNETLFPHIGTPVRPEVLQLKEAIELERQEHKIVDRNTIQLMAGGNNDELANDVLNWLSTTGEILTFRDPAISHIVVLDVPWFSGIAGHIFKRQNISLMEKNAWDESPFPEVFQVIGPPLRTNDISTLWQQYIEDTMGTSDTRTAFVSSCLKKLKILFVQFGIMIPVDQDNGPLSREAVCSASALRKAEFIPPVASKNPPGSVDTAWIDSVRLVCIPSRLEPGDQGSYLDVHQHHAAGGDVVSLAHVVDFYNIPPKGLMEHIATVLLRNLILVCNNDDKKSKSNIKVKKVLFWRTKFEVKFVATEKSSKKETALEATCQLEDPISSRWDLGLQGQRRFVKSCLVIICNEAGAGAGKSDGRSIWESGYGLFTESIKAVVLGFSNLRLELRAICPSCLMTAGICNSHSWTGDEIRAEQKRHLPDLADYLTCPRGPHNVPLRLLMGRGKAPDVVYSEQNVNRAIVVVGLFDDRQKRGKIVRLGSGFFLDSDRGFIATAARNVTKIMGRERFGASYDGIIGGKLVIGVIPADNQQNTSGSTNVVYRYFAKVCVKDPSMSDPTMPRCCVDACILKITSRFENDVNVSNGDQCSDEFETLLRNNMDRIRAEQLVSLPLVAPPTPSNGTQSTAYKLEDHVTIWGFDQPKQNLFSLNEARGYISQQRLDRDSAPQQYQYQPQNILVVTCSRTPNATSIGCPCLNQKGEVIGIFSCTDPNEDYRSFVVPISEWYSWLVALQQPPTPPAPPPPVA